MPFSFAKLKPFIHVLIGGVLLIIGLGFTWQTWRQASGWLATRGTVITNQLKDGRSGKSYYPEVEFRTDNGETILFVDRIGTDPLEFSEGDQVVVLYNPSYPQEARIKSWMRLWLMPTIFLSLGFGVLVIGEIVRRFL